MSIRSVWREWENDDGTRCAILIFPESYSEAQALDEVGIEESRLVKTGEQRLKAEATCVCEYHVLSKGVKQKPSSV